MNKKILLIFVLLAFYVPLYANNLPLTDENIANKLRDIQSTINMAIDLSVNLENNGEYYNNMEDIIQKAILPQLKNPKYKYGTLTLNGGAKLYFFRANSQCNIISPLNKEEINKNNACATVDIDINGYDSPNKFLKEIDNPQDKYRFLLFANGIITEHNSLEEQFLKLSNLNGIKIYDTKLYLYAGLTNNNDKKQKYALEIRFFNSKNEQVYSKVFSGEIDANGDYDFSTEINYNELPKGVTSYKVRLIDVQ